MLLLLAAPAWASWFATLGANAPTPPAGLSIALGHVENELEVTFANTGAGVVTIDWATSVLIRADGSSDRLAPGFTRRKDLSTAYPPSVIVPGATLSTLVVVDSMCDLKGCKATLSGVWKYGFHVDLALTVDGVATRLRLPIRVDTHKGLSACEHYDTVPCVEVR